MRKDFSESAKNTLRTDVLKKIEYEIKRLNPEEVSEDEIKVFYKDFINEVVENNTY